MLQFQGRHFHGSYTGCDRAALEDLEQLEQEFTAAVVASGATIVNSVRHVFSPNGITILLLLSESHASIHTYPEYLSCFVDLFTCGKQCRAESFDEALRRYLRPEKSCTEIILRGSPEEGLMTERLSSSHI